MHNLDRGEFNKRVTFSNPVKTPDGAGGNTEVYTIFLTTWARVKDDGGSRVFQSAEDQVLQKKRFEVYYRASLATALRIDTRIGYAGKDYSIDRPMLVNEEKIVYRFDATAR
jgi:SPP1 family predicted phage head-tail adaptor